MIYSKQDLDLNNHGLKFPELKSFLYHGSTIEVAVINLAKSASGKDFGQGFYTTSLRNQAVKFASIKAKRIGKDHGFVSVFQYRHNPDVKITKFEKADGEWLAFVLKNRGFPEKEKDATDANLVDIVIGPVANDAVGLVLNQLLIGTYGDPASAEARNIAIQLLDTTRLTNQVFFGTEQGISCLQFMEAFEVGINRPID
jgi:uncharacterized DUF497 family protein